MEEYWRLTKNSNARQKDLEVGLSWLKKIICIRNSFCATSTRKSSSSDQKNKHKTNKNNLSIKWIDFVRWSIEILSIKNKCADNTGNSCVFCGTGHWNWHHITSSCKESIRNTWVSRSHGSICKQPSQLKHTLLLSTILLCVWIVHQCC